MKKKMTFLALWIAAYALVATGLCAIYWPAAPIAAGVLLWVDLYLWGRGR